MRVVRVRIMSSLHDSKAWMDGDVLSPVDDPGGGGDLGTVTVLLGDAQGCDTELTVSLPRLPAY